MRPCSLALVAGVACLAASASALTLRTRTFVVGQDGSAVCWFHNVGGAAKSVDLDFVWLPEGPGIGVSPTCSGVAAGVGCSRALVEALPGEPFYCSISVNAKPAEVRGGVLVLDANGHPVLSLDAN